MRTGTLGDRFDARANALNLVRLCLALEVVLWHSYALRGNHLPVRATWFFADVGVDGFFALSGFLICRSWLNRPHLGAFLLARARRILPGLWTCLVVTAFGIVPLACLLSGAHQPDVADQLSYVWRNADIRVSQWGIGHTLAGAVDPGWDGPLWTLRWEVLCYLAVAALGVTRVLRPRVVLGAAVGFWLLNVTIASVGGVPYGGSPAAWMIPRAGLMFAMGAAIWCWRDRVVLDPRLALVLLAAVPVGVWALPNYRVVAAPALAYLCVYAGVALGRFPRLVLRNDLSYGVYIYAFPAQQTLLLLGLGSVGYFAFAGLSIVATAPLAAASWFLVERRAVRRRVARVPSISGMVFGGWPGRLRSRQDEVGVRPGAIFR